MDKVIKNIFVKSAKTSLIKLINGWMNSFPVLKSVILSCLIFILLFFSYSLVNQTFQIGLLKVIKAATALPIYSESELKRLTIDYNYENITITASKMVYHTNGNYEIALPNILFNIKTHFYVPFILTIALLISYRLSFLQKLVAIFASSVIYFGLFLLKFSIILYETAKQQIIYDNSTKKFATINPESLVFKFIAFINQVINTHSNISTKGLIAIAIFFVSVFIVRIVFKKKVGEI
ncbi:MAG: hypothetical protein NT007_13100 [Candidatus Kapabacteria bacterium]|nr:hypothetical protein [Candidatus Kapabacteria bacterium]